MGRELTQDPSSHGLTDEDIIHIPGLLSRSVRLENGAIARYVTSGETGPAVILLHGGIEGSSGTAGWRFMAPFLGANGFQWDYEHLDSDELWRKGRVVGAVIRGRLYFILLDAARSHYYATTVGDFEAIVASARRRR